MRAWPHAKTLLPRALAERVARDRPRNHESTASLVSPQSKTSRPDSLDQSPGRAKLPSQISYVVANFRCFDGISTPKNPFKNVIMRDKIRGAGRKTREDSELRVSKVDRFAIHLDGLLPL
jgi:hypothetical protein